jgi:hypothetical protein
MPALQTTLPNRSLCLRMRRVTSCSGQGKTGQKAGAGPRSSRSPPPIAAVLSAGGAGTECDERARGPSAQPYVSAAKLAKRAGGSSEVDRTWCSLRR